MAMTPDQWLPILAKRLDNGAPRVRKLRSYRDGNAPLPEGGKNVRASWERFQKESRTNWGQLILEAVTDRIVVKGITVAGDSQNEVARQAQRIYRDNRMDLVFQTWLRDGLGDAQSFLTVWSGEQNQAVITADSLQNMIVAEDPLQPWRVRAALRVWRDIDRLLDYALVWADDGSYQYFTRPSREKSSGVTAPVTSAVGDTYGSPGALHSFVAEGDWEPMDVPVGTGSSEPPIVVYNNPGGVGEYEPHIDIINRINNGILDRRVIQAMQAFRQRALKSSEGEGLAQKDAEGNDIDWAKLFEPAPGALWDLPPGIDIWESSPTDIRPLLDGSRDDIRQLSAVSRTPLPILMPDNANQSAAGAIATETGYISKCGTRLTEAKIGLEAALVKALELEGVEGLEDMDVDVQFEPVERVSLAEKSQAAAQMKGIISDKAIQRDYLGWGPDEIRQDALDRADEALRAFALMPQPARNAPQGNVNDGSGSGRPS